MNHRIKHSRRQVCKMYLLKLLVQNHPPLSKNLEQTLKRRLTKEPSQNYLIDKNCPFHALRILQMGHLWCGFFNKSLSHLGLQKLYIDGMENIKCSTYNIARRSVLIVFQRWLKKSCQEKKHVLSRRTLDNSYATLAVHINKYTVIHE